MNTWLSLCCTNPGPVWLLRLWIKIKNLGCPSTDITVELWAYQCYPVKHNGRNYKNDHHYSIQHAYKSQTCSAEEDQSELWCFCSGGISGGGRLLALTTGRNSLCREGHSTRTVKETRSIRLENINHSSFPPPRDNDFKFEVDRLLGELINRADLWYFSIIGHPRTHGGNK